MSQIDDLQDFLDKELNTTGKKTQSRSFVPLTDGLGLESPQKKEAPFEEAPKAPPPIRFDRDFPQKKHDVGALFDRPEDATRPFIPKQEALSAIIETEVVSTALKPEPQKQQQPSKKVAPPPLPQPSGLRRMLAAMIDEMFVLTLWLIAIIITSNVLTGFSTGLSNQVFKEFENPLFQRFAMLEFGTIWLSYFAVCLGVMDMTFGMWVWGVRVSYGNRNDTNFLLRKMMRIVWSFIFYAPVVSLVLLSIRRKGRNLLDVLSGTNLYYAT